MLEKRNLLAHTYDEAQADLAFDLILNEYYPLLEELLQKFQALEQEHRSK